MMIDVYIPIFHCLQIERHSEFRWLGLNTIMALETTYIIQARRWWWWGFEGVQVSSRGFKGVRSNPPFGLQII